MIIILENSDFVLIYIKFNLYFDLLKFEIRNKGKEGKESNQRIGKNIELFKSVSFVSFTKISK